jgi:hypothetical protein
MEDTEVLSTYAESITLIWLCRDKLRRRRWGCRLAWSRLGDLGSLDPGPNPGSPTIIL